MSEQKRKCNLLTAKLMVLIAIAIFLHCIAATAETGQEAIDAYNAGDFARWIEISRQLAIRGDATAMCILGEAYRTGNQVEKNFEEAFKWFRLAADQGDADAWLNLGFAWESGEGVPRNHAEAYYCYYVASRTRPQAKKFLDRVAWKLSAHQRRDIRSRVDGLPAERAENKATVGTQQSTSENEAQ